jgi:hypothetical protein
MSLWRRPVRPKDAAPIAAVKGKPVVSVGFALNEEANYAVV